MSGQKRPCDSSAPSSSSGAPPDKRREREGGEDGVPGVSATAVETVIKLGGVSNSEEQDVKALHVKNRKLGESLDQRQVIEDELRERIERLETRQATDDASLLILNRYWNQVTNYSFTQIMNNMQLKHCQQGETTTSFLATLASSSSEEMEAELQERVESSQKQANHVVEIYDSLKTTVEQLKKDQDSGAGDWGERGSRSLGRAVARADTRVSELQGLIEELQWDMEKIRRRETRLNTHLGEILERVNSKGYKVCGEASSVCGTITINKRKFEEMNSELEENRELAENRLSELQRLQQDLQTVNQENNNMKVELLSRAEGVVRESSEYRCLQSQFSVLYNESVGLKSQLDETRTRLNTTRTARLRQLEHMENDEVSLQRKVRTEVFQLEDTLAQVRKEYEMLRIEFEQTLAANEQAGPINREMRHLISTLQTHNQQMKGEVVKYKLRLREAQTDLSQVRDRLSDLSQVGDRLSDLSQVGDRLSDLSQVGDRLSDLSQVGDRLSDLSQVGDRLSDLTQESQREMKLLLDMYRSAPKEQRDKVQLMAAEKKAKSEAEDLKQRLRDLEERERREGKKMADEEALRKIRSVEEQINILNKKLSLAKQEEDALLSEMDVTGQAFEDMQEQNIRLMQQLREKDDANFKLMSERIKSNQIHKLLKEEKEELADQLLTLKTQVDAQLQVVRKLEEKERLLQGTISTAERELALRTQALDMNKRKVTQESSVLSEEVRSQLDQVQQRLGNVREEVIENSISREKESFNARRAQEDISKLRRKIEKAKKPAETVLNGDDILNEEINDYKARLTCPCCNSRVKDAVLTKCFHVFCFECVKTRYDTRQRKCPKCNAAFGANDFHRIYIG
uniref:E3 ubiquitin protein ligase n=1 Tax=Oncorhynchus mykiss TaxID=8022 RepID=A0A8C7PE56_ONCMY